MGIWSQRGSTTFLRVCPLTSLPSIPGAAGPDQEQKEWAVAFIFGKLFLGKQKFFAYSKTLKNVRDCL